MTQADAIYEDHSVFAQPKLSLKPSELIRRQCPRHVHVRPGRDQQPRDHRRRDVDVGQRLPASRRHVAHVAGGRRTTSSTACPTTTSHAIVAGNAAEGLRLRPRVTFVTRAVVIRSTVVVTSTAVVGPQQPSTYTPDRATGFGAAHEQHRRRARRRCDRFGAKSPRPPVISRPTPRAARLAVVDARTLRVSLLPTLDLVTIESEPSAPELERLTGRTSQPAFGARSSTRCPKHAAPLPTCCTSCSMISRWRRSCPDTRCTARAGARRRRGELYKPTVDLCAGWQAGGTLMQVIETDGMPPMTIGPAAPSLERCRRPRRVARAAGPPPRTVRRRRRIDLTVGDALARRRDVPRLPLRRRRHRVGRARVRAARRRSTR